MCKLMGRNYDKNKKDVPKYKVSDLVILNSKNLKICRLAKNFDYKMLGPFRVDKIISPMVVHLQLPEFWTVYPVFHVKLLELFRLQRGAPRLFAGDFGGNRKPTTTSLRG
jgi:hypothetical protein